MASASADGALNDDPSPGNDPDSPPPDPVLQALPYRLSGFATANDVKRVTKIRLQVEFPMQNNNRKNNVADYFKRFITVLFAAEPGITLLNWQDPTLNPIQRSMNLQGTEEVISQYFTGMQIHHQGFETERKQRQTAIKFLSLKNVCPPHHTNVTVLTLSGTAVTSIIRDEDFVNGKKQTDQKQK